MEFDEQDLFEEGRDDEERGGDGDASSSDSDSPEEASKANAKTPSRRAGGAGFSGGLARYAAAEAKQEERAEIPKPKLGTSMPIHIRQSPMRAAMKLEDRDENVPHANTFVPLHDMDQPLDLSGRAASISNASVAKREQLLQRNKILRRTGFIESQTQQPGEATGVKEPALSDLMDPLRMQPKRMIPIKEGSHLEPSALSAALSPSPDIHHRMPASMPRHTQLGF